MGKKIAFLIGGFIVGFIISFYYTNQQFQNQASSKNRPAANSEELPPNHPPVESEKKAANGASSFGPLEAFGAAPNNAEKAKEGEKSAGKKAGEVYQNIKVLKDLPSAQLMTVMQSFSEGLGVNCTHCHTSTQELAKDDKPAKEVARKMLIMVREINKGYPTEGQVTCYTCHRGSVKPAS